jgi:hypothetical protein
VLRRDGFVSLDAGETTGTVVTQPLRPPGSRLFVNVNAPQGVLHVDVLNEAGEVVARSMPLTGDLLSVPVAWKEGSIADFMSREVTLRFRLRNGRLYSYWVE